MNPAALHRRFQLVSGPPSRCREEALAAWQPEGLWVGDRAPSPVHPVPPRELGRWLGRETDLLVFDALEGFCVEAFAMALGLVRGGGTFLLLAPPLEQWPSRPDREMERLAVAGLPPRVPSPFLQRLARLLRQPPAPAAPPEASPLSPDGLTADQEAALELVLRTANGHPRRPLLLTAHRGQGKSSLLGIAAARLLEQGRKRILVTAPRRSATAILFHHARARLPGARSGPGLLEHGRGKIRFVPPDLLSAELPPADLLLVDEAAGIPLPLLERLVENYNRVALASTVHGYEGSGRGFQLRLARRLDRLRPGWRHFRLRQPVRWAAGDPLETLGFRALLLDAEPAPLEQERPGAVSFHLLEGEELLRDEALLEQLFGLMVSAHYRTTPSDLRYILDAPNLRVLAAREGGALLGAVLVAREGELDNALRQQVLEAGRRPRGHLLPQLLTTRCGLPEALEARCWRVVRIAVHPRLQGQGLGSRLLAHLLDLAAGEGVEVVGSSFGATAELARFWMRQGFLPLRLGHRREASSGAHALLVARGLDGPWRRRLSRGAERFREGFVHQLAEPFRQLDPELALALHALPRPPLPPEMHRQLRAFARGRLPYLDALAALHRLACRLHSPEEPGQQLLLMKVLQHRSWSEVARHFGLTGKREAEVRLRQAVLDLIPRPGVGLDGTTIPEGIEP